MASFLESDPIIRSSNYFSSGRKSMRRRLEPAILIKSPLKYFWDIAFNIRHYSNRKGEWVSFIKQHIYEDVLPNIHIEIPRCSMITRIFKLKFKFLRIYVIKKPLNFSIIVYSAKINKKLLCWNAKPWFYQNKLVAICILLSKNAQKDLNNVGGSIPIDISIDCVTITLPILK